VPLTNLLAWHSEERASETECKLGLGDQEQTIRLWGGGSDGVEDGVGAARDADAEGAGGPRRGRELVRTRHAGGAQRRLVRGDAPPARPEAQMGGLGGALLHHRGADHAHAHGRAHGQARHSDRDLGAQAGAGAPGRGGGSRGKLGFRFLLREAI
jgi:hypothetical protein